MCFDDDSRPPIAPMAGGALDSSQLVLTAADGNRLAAFEARALDATGAAILILPDVRGLHPYYEELALRFAEHGFDAIAIDYFGRTAGAEPRAESFEYMPHVRQLTWPGTQADIRAGIDQIRSRGTTPDRLFSIGFCMGGRMSFLAATLGVGFEGVIGFYGRVVGPHPSGSPAPAELTGKMHGRVLALFAGDDEGIPPADVAAFERALADAGLEHRVLTYPDTPHSFFDRKASQYAEQSAAAWNEILEFVRRATAPRDGIARLIS